MRSQIYLPDMTRKYHKQQVHDFVWVYFEKLLPVFEHMEEEADSVAEEFYDIAMNSYGPDDYADGSEFVDDARDRGITHYHMLSLGKYTLTASWHATLYEFFQQQLRLFLFDEVRHSCNVDFTDFCTDLTQIQEVFSLHKLDVSSFGCWNRIGELRLLCNVIKHGDGPSSAQLRILNPTLYRIDTIADYLELYRSTLLEETLAIDDTTLRSYVDSVCAFWDEVPERSFSGEL